MISRYVIILFSYRCFESMEQHLWTMIMSFSILVTRVFKEHIIWQEQLHKNRPLHRYSLVVLPSITFARKNVNSNSSYNYSAMFSGISRSLNTPLFLGISSSVLAYSYRFLRNATFNWYPKKYISSFELSSALGLPLPKSWTDSKVARSNAIRIWLIALYRDRGK
jgi:hypothetical protein